MAVQQGSVVVARCAMLALAFVAAHALHAQTPAAGAPPKPASTAKPATEPPPTKTMDTGESIGFMGKSLWFEVRRRLNLTTEEEEKKHKEETKQVKMKVGGLRVEKSAEGPAAELKR